MIDFLAAQTKVIDKLLDESLEEDDKIQAQLPNLGRGMRHKKNRWIKSLLEGPDSQADPIAMTSVKMSAGRRKKKLQKKDGPALKKNAGKIVYIYKIEFSYIIGKQGLLFYQFINA